MNLDRYNSLPDDLKAIIDQNSGVEVARAFGAAMDAGDTRGLKIAQDLGNNIVTLDEAETARWKEASKPTLEKWLADMASSKGQALYDAAVAAVNAETGA